MRTTGFTTYAALEFTCLQIVVQFFRTILGQASCGCSNKSPSQLFSDKFDESISAACSCLRLRSAPQIKEASVLKVSLMFIPAVQVGHC